MNESNIPLPYTAEDYRRSNPNETYFNWAPLPGLELRDYPPKENHWTIEEIQGIVSKVLKEEQERKKMKQMPEETALLVTIQSNAMTQMSKQRDELKKFISGQLTEGINGDYAVIPGTNKPSLLKPGAEKLANIFQLGTRIVSSQRNEIGGGIGYTYRYETYHLPTGKAISQEEACASTLERKFKSRDKYDVENTVMKMAQKRAYVGAIIKATGASDFFTQDMEDVVLEKEVSSPQKEVPLEDTVMNFGNTHKGKKIKDIPPEALMSAINWVDQLKDCSPFLKEFSERAKKYLLTVAK